MGLRLHIIEFSEWLFRGSWYSYPIRIHLSVSPFDSPQITFDLGACSTHSLPCRMNLFNLSCPDNVLKSRIFNGLKFLRIFGQRKQKKIEKQMNALNKSPRRFSVSCWRSSNSTSIPCWKSKTKNCRTNCGTESWGALTRWGEIVECLLFYADEQGGLDGRIP